MRGIGKRFVYVLRSDKNPEHHYVGTTSDVESRLDWHNHGPCGHTTRHRPWSMVVVIELPTERQAVRFEKYLKSGSGRAFARRHFGPDQHPDGEIRVRRADGIPCDHVPSVSGPPVAGALRRLRRARAVSESGRSANRRSEDPVYASLSRLSWVVYGIDVRSGVRLLHVEAVQSALIVAMLALGIGANLAIFGAIDLAPLRLAQTRDAGRTGAVIDVRRRPDRHRRSLMRLEVVCSLSAFSF